MTDPAPVGPTGSVYSPAATSTGVAGAADFPWSPSDAALWGIGKNDARPEAQYDRAPRGEASPRTGWTISASGRGGTGTPGIGTPAHPLTKPIGTILQKLGNYTPAEVGMLQLQLQSGGFIGAKTKFTPGQVDDTTIKAFTKLLQSTARSTAAGHDKTWSEVLADSIQATQAAGATGAHTSVTKSTSLTDAKSSEAVVTAAFKDAMGRFPTAAEKAKFLKHLNAEEASHPTVTKTQYDAQGNATTQSTSGGIGASGTTQMATDQAMQNPDYANYQAAAFYMPLMFQALGASTPLEGGL